MNLRLLMLNCCRCKVLNIGFELCLSFQNCYIRTISDFVQNMQQDVLGLGFWGTIPTITTSLFGGLRT